MTQHASLPPLVEPHAAQVFLVRLQYGFVLQYQVELDFPGRQQMQADAERNSLAGTRMRCPPPV